MPAFIFVFLVSGSYYTDLSYNVVHDVFVVFTFTKFSVNSHTNARTHTHTHTHNRLMALGPGLPR